MNPETLSTDDQERSSNFPTRLHMLIIVIVWISLSVALWLYIQHEPVKTIDDKVKQLNDFRSDKKAREAIIEDQKKAIFVLDQKIIPLKCDVYGEVGAKDSWESECRDDFEAQKEKITSQVSTELEEETVPEFQ